ncbi:hypothetical protein ERX35_011185 [Macrococcus equipercicus]|uniref:FtsK domain-containing protein n=1 Tax=Macrococcus equipercicus TaxID=69967 RepID=A0ABQ6R614_9STAP|nr:hypothetical protein [Macrococcus equipercicus]KAA1035160.1 hypothetical protein ERX35_011185 [Macrococcus equipercicus]
MDQLKEKILRSFKKQNQLGKIYRVSVKSIVSEKRTLSLKAKFNIFLILVVCAAGLIALSMNYSLFLSWVLIFLFLGLFIRFIYKSMKNRFGNPITGRPIEVEIRSFILRNNLYELSNGYLLDEIDISYEENQDDVQVFILKNGGSKFDKVAEDCGNYLESALGLQLHSKNITLEGVRYTFLKYKIERKEVSHMALEEIDKKIDIYGDIKLNLDRNYSMIINGVSGSGKSYFLYYLITEFARRRFANNDEGMEYSKLFIIDPKMSDLYKLGQSLPENHVGTTLEEAFDMVEEFTRIMEQRKQIYSKSTGYDMTMLSLGYPPMLLVIDEYSSLIALMDKKEKERFEKAIGNIARLGRQLSMGIWICLQQASSEFISTGIREQLVNKCYMGANISQESAKMTFNRSVGDLPVVTEVGEGIISIDGKEPVLFQAPKFNRPVQDVIQPILKHVGEQYRLDIKE